MYILFLCLRYLRSRIIAYFAVLAVALCVAMMLIVVSVMNGFLDKIEQAAKGLFGDVVIESASAAGFGRYDEFIAELEQKVPEVEAASPFIVAYSILRVPGTDYIRPMQVAGLRLPAQAKVTSFAEGLGFQPGSETPSFDPPFEVLLETLSAELARTQAMRKDLLQGRATWDLPPEQAQLADVLQYAVDAQTLGKLKLEIALRYQAELGQVARALSEAEREHGPTSPQALKLAERLDEFREESGVMEPDNRVILGLGIPGLMHRTGDGQTIRLIVPGQNVVISVPPLGRGMTSDITPNNARLTIIDDCRTDVSSIDSEQIYLPFETAQKLNNMDAQYAADGELVRPARCSQIHVKVRREFSRDEQLHRIAVRINELWDDFTTRYPDAETTEVTARTWRERQARIIAPIQQQRTLVVTMFAIISLVSVVLIFVIFYTIVVQKTRDIGVIKAVGGSSWGVAQVFLGYGAMIGLVGAILGCVGGYYFVRYINPIQDGLDTWLGFRVWSREWFLFEKIPNTVEPLAAVLIMVGAIAAGLVGAMLPAVRAARMQPVEALRYE